MKRIMVKIICRILLLISLTSSVWNTNSESDTDLLSGRGERQHHTGMDVYNQT
ncbi:Hypothetical predicted protein [Scomber scombrus]|uniref:Uncharacterized protein n=1 Tax=Scomber scombrus TaxID=13677 RepID=A0AAV1N173_SCOSC